MSMPCDSYWGRLTLRDFRSCSAIVEAESVPWIARQITRFSGPFGPANPDTPQRQEAQIVQSQLDL